MRNMICKRTVSTICLLCLLLQGVMAQGRLKGAVTEEESGEPLIGASIVIKGTSRGTVTDFDGSFELRVDSFPLILEVSYVGYEAKDVPVENDAEDISIVLSGDEGITLAMTEVRAQRISDKQKASPLTVESLDILAI
ncbi:MAG: hypothetical protein HKN76_06315, partial [Saprospiraceae bacterium]|nr:hypothetical protein [Saprospiraceae bacterium]